MGLCFKPLLKSLRTSVSGIQTPLRAAAGGVVIASRLSQAFARCRLYGAR